VLHWPCLNIPVNANCFVARLVTLWFNIWSRIVPTAVFNEKSWIYNLPVCLLYISPKTPDLITANRAFQLINLSPTCVFPKGHLYLSVYFHTLRMHMTLHFLYVHLQPYPVFEGVGAFENKVL